MPKFSLSANLLTVFTSPEHAESIEGELLEEARSRGRFWFWGNLVWTTLALWWKGVSESPLPHTGLTLACGAAWFLTVFVGEVDDSPGLIVFGSLLVGFVCVRMAPVRGIHAAVAVVLLAGPTIAVISILTHLPVEGVATLVPSLWDGGVAVVPLLVGSLIARRQIVRKVTGAR
jgi:hypothetical protein